MSTPKSRKKARGTARAVLEFRLPVPVLKQIDEIAALAETDRQTVLRVILCSAALKYRKSQARTKGRRP